MELLRRLLTLICVLAAVWTAVVTSNGVYQVKLENFAREQQRSLEQEADSKRLMQPLVGEDLTRDLVLNPTARGPVDEFQAHELSQKGLYLSKGQGWVDLVKEVAALANGKAAPAIRAVHASRNDLTEYTYYALNDNRLQQLHGVISPRNAFSYVEVDTPKGARYLAVTYLSPVDALRSASPALTSPYRRQSPWWLLAGLLLYAFLPWPTRREDTLRFNLARSVVVPDIMGFILAGGFYALALLVVSRDSNMYGILEASGWLAVSLWSLLFTLFGLSILIVGFWYASFSLQILPDGMCLTTWGNRKQQITYSELAEAREYIYRAPRWLVVLGWLAFLSRPLRGGASLALLLQEHPGIELVKKDGRVTRFVVSYFPEWTRLLDALLAAGVPLSKELREEQAQERNIDVIHRATPRWIPITVVLLLAAGIGVGGWSWLQPQYAAPPIPKRSLSNIELTAEHKVLLELQQVNDQTQAAFARWEKAPPAQKEAAYTEYQRLLDRSQALSDRFDQINSGQSELAPREIEE